MVLLIQTVQSARKKEIKNQNLSQSKNHSSLAMPSDQTKSNTIPQIFFNVSFAMQQPGSISPRLKSTHDAETSPKMDTNRCH